MDWKYNEKHTYVWMRRNGDGFEAYKIDYWHGNKFPWFAGGGTFSLDDYDKQSHGLNPELPYDDWRIAECLFDRQWANFDLESFETMDEAVKFVRSLMD